MNTPLVNIMMPVYNGLPLLKASIESIKRQSYPHWQCIICDDGSTDGTWEYLQSLLQHTCGSSADATIVDGDKHEINNLSINLAIQGNVSLDSSFFLGPRPSVYRPEDDNLLQKEAIDDSVCLGACSQADNNSNGKNGANHISSEGGFSGFCLDDNGAGGEAPSFIILRNETNQGRGYTRQRILEACTAPYICMLDAGDLMHPDRLKKQVEYLEAHPEVSLCSTAMLSFGTQTDTLVYRSSGIHPDTIMTFDGTHACCFAPSMFRNPRTPSVASNSVETKTLKTSPNVCEAKASSANASESPIVFCGEATGLLPDAVVNPNMGCDVDGGLTMGARSQSQTDIHSTQSDSENNSSRGFSGFCQNKNTSNDCSNSREASFDTSLRFCEDQHFLRQYLLQSPQFYCMSEPLYYYSEFNSCTRSSTRRAYYQDMLTYYHEHLYKQSLICLLKYIYSIVVFPFLTDEQMLQQRAGRPATQQEREKFNNTGKIFL